MEQESFNELVSKAIDGLPLEFIDMMENVDVVVEDEPTVEQLGKARLGEEGETLLGLYEGVPQTSRTTGYSMVLPDKISLFQRPIESICHNDEEIYFQIQKTLKHEIAHHFGISDKRLDEIEDETT